MDGVFMVELLSIAFVSGSFVAAVRANQKGLEKTQSDQAHRFDQLDFKVDRIHERFDNLPCRTGGCRERV
jgi:hypothetical protein